MKTLLLALLCAFSLRAQLVLPNAVAAPMPEQQFVDVNGKPLAGSFLCTFAAGSSTPQATYTDSTAGTPNTNPIVLDSSGRASIWVGALLYKFVLYTGGNGSCPGTGAVQWSQDNVGDTTLFFTNYVKSVGTCSLITYTPTQTGGVTRTCSAKLNDTVSLTDLGAVCNNIHDDTSAFQAAAALANITITLPATGGCRLDSASVSIPATVALVVPQGSGIEVGLGETLTINAPFSAGPYQIFTGAGTVLLPGTYTVESTWFLTGDCGIQLNNAYQALGATGGVIKQQGSCTIVTPVVFGVNNKQVILQGTGDESTNLTYAPSTGTAITLNYGTGLRMGHGIRDLTITGPGHSTSTIGLLVGGNNGAQGATIRDFKIQSFGVNMQFDSQTWIVQVEQGMIRDGGMNVLYPPVSAGVVGSGENIQWNHVTFADAPAPYTKSIWLQASESDFTDCSFDQAQLYIGNGVNGGPQINIKGSHFENPNSSTQYDFIVIDAEASNLLRLTDSFFEQDFNEGTIPEFITTKGGQLYITNLGIYTPFGPLTYLVRTSGTANVTIWGYDDLSGQTGQLVGGTSTGYMQLWGGASINASPFNIRFGPNASSAPGGGTMDITGEIKSSYSASIANSGVLASTVPTGVPGLLIGSTTPVPNLFGGTPQYNTAGTQQLNIQHVITGQVHLTGGAATITLTGLAQYPSFGAAVCIGNDLTGANAVSMTVTSSSTITVAGTGTDNISYFCFGY